MIKGERVTFKCPRCEFTFVGNAGEIAVITFAHYKEVHDGKV